MKVNKYSQLDFSNDYQTIGVVAPYKTGSYIRIFSHLISLDNENFRFCFINGRDKSKLKKDLLNNIILLDVIILERNYVNLGLAKLIIEKSKCHNVKIIYEIDDDLINIDKSHPEYELYSKQSKTIEYIAKNADEIIVSTNYLKNVMLNYNDKVNVIHNVLTDDWNMDIAPNSSHSSNIVKIGYMGTKTHRNDLKLIEEAIYNIKEYYDEDDRDIVFEIIGGSDENLDWAENIEIPDDKTFYPDFVSWIRRTADWDIALSPLEDTPINRAKSELKYLEYTALNTPAIYSNIGPYKEHITNEFNGLLCDNTVQCWQENIMKLIEDPDLRKKILMNAKDDIGENYSPEKVNGIWREILKSKAYGKNDKKNFKLIHNKNILRIKKKFWLVFKRNK